VKEPAAPEALVEEAVPEAPVEEAVAEVPAEPAEEEEALAEGEIEIREGESLAEIKDRIRKEQQKAKKPTIPPELLNSANSYEDKVGVVRMVVQADQSRVASVIRGMIQVGK
jgi:flagellar M-ring protein FliF